MTLDDARKYLGECYVNATLVDEKVIDLILWAFDQGQEYEREHHARDMYYRKLEREDEQQL